MGGEYHINSALQSAENSNMMLRVISIPINTLGNLNFMIQVLNQEHKESGSAAILVPKNPQDKLVLNVSC